MDVEDAEPLMSDTVRAEEHDRYDLTNTHAFLTLHNAFNCDIR
jgi:hypothetical protein